MNLSTWSARQFCPMTSNNTGILKMTLIILKYVQLKEKKSSFGLCYSLLFNFTFFVSGKLYNYSNILLIIWDWISVNIRQEWSFLACWWYLDSEMTVNCCFYRIFGTITDTKRIVEIVFRRASYWHGFFRNGQTQRLVKIRILKTWVSTIYSYSHGPFFSRNI